jgi:DNA-binding response OmpR family regulator
VASQSNQKPRVLVVEDETSIRNGLCDVLLFRGFSVEAVEDGKLALAALQRERFDLVVLDVMLPELDGFSVCERVRAGGDQTPVLILTAKGSEDDILRGFELGADDYVTKPFSVRQFAARVQALLRRSPRASDETFVAGAFEIDPARSVARVDGTEIALSAREVRILRLLADEPGRIVSRRTLLRDVWELNNAENLETRTVDMHIAKLRKKLGKRADHLVETVRGQGYRLWTPSR